MDIKIYFGHSQQLERTHVPEMGAQLLIQRNIYDLPCGVSFHVDKDSFSFSSNDKTMSYPPPIVETSLNHFGFTQLDNGFAVTSELRNRPRQLDTGNSWVTYASPAIANLSLLFATGKTEIDSNRWE
ncbi:MAG: hypothetical protein CM1200mP39_18550 [Dehalococcoidia bacterium]|nr:MAG: hypothetical protein CM1200mP39_18550 [Dehalococcoidia bacterium]